MAKQDGNAMFGRFPCSVWKERNERSNVGGVLISSRKDAPSRNGYMVNGRATETSIK